MHQHCLRRARPNETHRAPKPDETPIPLSGFHFRRSDRAEIRIASTSTNLSADPDSHHQQKTRPLARSSQGRTPIFPFPLQFSPPPGLASRGLAAAATRRPHRLDRRPTSAHHETFQISIFPRKYPTRDNETGVGAVQDTQDRRASLADSVKSRPRSLHNTGPGCRPQRNIDSATTRTTENFPSQPGQVGSFQPSNSPPSPRDGYRDICPAS